MEELLRDGLHSMGIAVQDSQIETMIGYAKRLRKANETTNLTAITEPEAIVRLHFLDSAALLQTADFENKKVLDVGTGAGFPGVPLRILVPAIRLSCLDSVNKKVKFIAGACSELGLDDIQCLWGRVEDMPQLREDYDIVVSRAVASMDLLTEMCLPLVRVGGLFLAMKGGDCGQEIQDAEPAITRLGGKLREIIRYKIPGTDVTHAVAVVEKSRPTPRGYPRSWSQMKKKPLR